MKRRRKNIDLVKKLLGWKRAKLEEHGKEFCWKETFPHCTENLSMSLFI